MFCFTLTAQTSTMDAEWRAMREAVATRCARIEDEAALDRAKNNASNAARGQEDAVYQRDHQLTNIVARFTRARLSCTHTALALRWTGLSHRIHSVRHRR